MSLGHALCRCGPQQCWENVQRGKKLEKKLQSREEVYNLNSGLHQKDNSRELPTILYILHTGE